MRKHLPLTLLSFVLLSCQKERLQQPAEEVPATKTVTFRVYASKDYSADYYAQTMADVTLQLGTIDKRTGITEVAWDTTFTPRSLVLYPQQGQMYVVEKTISIKESTHSLNAGFIIRYNTNGMRSMEAFGEGLGLGQNSRVLGVHL
jgi:hypothetical protein